MSVFIIVKDSTADFPYSVFIYKRAHIASTYFTYHFSHPVLCGSHCRRQLGC